MFGRAIGHFRTYALGLIVLLAGFLGIGLLGFQPAFFWIFIGTPPLPTPPPLTLSLLFHRAHRPGLRFRDPFLSGEEMLQEVNNYPGLFNY
jgi:hypothetical protein